jgi:TP901 family phage tail tape measure protein
VLVGAGFKNIEIGLKLALSGFTGPLGAAGQQLKAFGSDLSKAASDGSGNMEKVGKATAVAGGVMLAGFGMAAKATMGFEQELSNLQAASGATSAEMGLLRQQALDAGAATAFSASEAAEAQSELAKAGVSTADILSGGLEGALALAAAGSIDLARAAELGANAMATFGLKGSDMGRIADTLAAGANKSAADVESIGQALQQTGLVADQFGLSLEETVGVLSMFSQAGLKGSDAGTSMKTMLSRLVPQTAEAKATMEKLGIEMFDSQGKFIGIEAAAGELKTGLSGLTQEQRAAAMQTIFGADAIRAATILYEGGAEGVDTWTKNVTDSGYASEVAATKLDNLAGDLEGLRGSIETALIEGGSKATGALRFLAQGATDSVNAFGTLPGPVQSAGVAFAGVGGSALLAVGALGTMAPKVSAAMGALRGMGGAGNIAANGLASLGNNAGKIVPLAIGLGVAWQLYATRQAEAKANTDELTKAIQEQRDGVAGAEDAVIAKLLADDRAGDIIKKTGRSYEDFTRIIKQQGDDLDSLYDAMRAPEAAGVGYMQVLDKAADGGNRVAQSLQAMVAAGDLSEAELFELTRTLDELSDQHDDATNKATNQSKAEREVGDGAKDGKAGVDELTGGLQDNAMATEEATQKLQDYADTLRAQYDPLFAMTDALQGNRDAQAAVLQAQQDLNDVRHDGESTAADVAAAETKLHDALLDTGPAAYKATLAAIALKDAIDNQGLTTEGTRSMLLGLIDTMGLTQEEADALAQQFGINILVAEDVTNTPAITTVGANNVAPTQAQLRATKDAATDIPKKTSTRTDTARVNAAKVELWSVRDAANSIPRETIVHVKVIATGQNQIDIMKSKLLGNSRGGIVEFARGGMAVRHFAGGAENHVAQMARAGDMRVWAEPETGGESYIPLANDWRRPRAVSVLDATARRFGLQVAPQGAGRGDTIVHNQLSVPVHVSADMSAMALARLEDVAERAGRKALAAAHAGMS